MVALETDAADLIAAEPAAVGGGIDPGDERGAVEGVIAAIGAVFALLFTDRQLRAGVAQHRDHSAVGGKRHHTHRNRPIRGMHELAGIVVGAGHGKSPRADDAPNNAAANAAGNFPYIRFRIATGGAVFVVRHLAQCCSPIPP